MLSKIESLRKEILYHDHLYDTGNPIISDSEYDEKYLELERLEREYPEFFSPDSPTQRITTTIVSDLKEVRHPEPMLSQQKFTTDEEVEKFVSEITKNYLEWSDELIYFLVQEKLDGITIVVTYENGRMTQAVSRGNGEVGEDLFHNVKHLDGLPKIIPFKGKLVVRAEAILPFEAFKKINEDGRYSNPRNLVSGSLRQLDSSKVVGKGFKAIVFDYVEAYPVFDWNSDEDRMNFLREQGFEVVHTMKFNESEHISYYIRDYGEKIRGMLPHMIDGMVLKVDDLNIRKRMGSTSKHPKWAAAFKFKSLDATTKLLNITDQVGKTGQITPVAELELVNIDGVNIQRASLHNYQLLAKKDIRIGDTVVVERANDVIPQVSRSIPEVRTGEEIIKETPQFCPACGSETYLDGENLYCGGLECTPQIAGKLQHYVSREAMNIDGLGEKMIQILFNKGIVTHILDLYTLEDKKDEICALEGFGEKKYEKMIAGIEESKNRPLPNVFYALSIRNTGLGSAKRISKVFHSLEDLLGLAEMDKEYSIQKLMTVEDFGEIKAESVYKFFADKHNYETIKRMIKLGINPVMEETTSEISNITGKVFVITGEVHLFENRKELQEKIESLGGKISGSVSKKTDFLINNDTESNSSKNKKAKDLGIPILSEEDFLKMI